MKLSRRDSVPLQTWPRWDDAPSLYGLGSSEQSAPQLRSNFASAPGLGSHVRRCIHRDWAHLIAVIRRNDGAHGPCIGHRHWVWCTAASGLLASRFANRPDSTPGSRRRPKDSSKVPLDKALEQGRTLTEYSRYAKGGSAGSMALRCFRVMSARHKRRPAGLAGTMRPCGGSVEPPAPSPQAAGRWAEPFARATAGDSRWPGTTLVASGYIRDPVCCGLPILPGQDRSAGPCR